MPDLSSLRLVKVPHAAPPYDCQVHGARCPAGEDVVAAPSSGEPGAEAAGLPALPGPGVAAGPGVSRPRQLAVVIVEVLAGVRPDRQLVPMATDRVRARVRNLAPLLTADRRPTIARIVMSRPADRVAEVSVVVKFGARSRALAMRFEHVAARPAAPGWPARPARWLCTALEAG
ncbi:MAG TPA: Rv3235 family protein [Streptosporangiaceae bacterium]|nr:Rv3235 family protein [Streptosporangiaceae bacterium]